MVGKNWTWIDVAGCGFHCFVSARFGSFWVVANFKTAERFKYPFFHSYENSYHGAYSKETKQFYFQFTSYINLSDVFLLYCRVWINRTGVIISFVLKSSLYHVYMRGRNYQFYWLISPARLFHSAQSFTFELNRKTILVLCW